MSEPQTDPRYYIAVHEGSHAVAAFLRNVAFESVTIVPQGDVDGFLRPSDISDWQPIPVTDDIIVALAGGIGARLARSQAGPWAGYEGDCRDRARAEDMAATWTSSPDEASAFLAYVRARTTNMVAHFDFQHLVDALVPELLSRDTLSERRARRVLWKACRARPMQTWPVVIGAGPRHRLPPVGPYLGAVFRRLGRRVRRLARRVKRRNLRTPIRMDRKEKP